MYVSTAVCTAVSNCVSVARSRPVRVGGVVGQTQHDRGVLARLQRAAQVHRVARRVVDGRISVTLVSPVIDQVAVSLSMMVVVTELLAPRAIGGTGGAGRGGERDGVGLITFHQRVVDRRQVDDQVAHRTVPSLVKVSLLVAAS